MFGGRDALWSPKIVVNVVVVGLFSRGCGRCSGDGCDWLGVWLSILSGWRWWWCFVFLMS